MKKNGFTLIELLAVIVILAIIALIATPIILGIINDAREKANERSVELYASAVRNAVATYQLTGTNYPKSFEDLTIQYDGTVECATEELYEDGSFYLEGCTVNGGMKEYSYGTKFVKLNKLCKPSNEQIYATNSLESGYKYDCDVDPNKEGYDYSFYVLNVEEKNVVLIMDSNICNDGTLVTDTNKCVYEWIDNDDYIKFKGNQSDWDNWEKRYIYGPITAMDNLVSATSSWVNLKQEIINTFEYCDMNLPCKEKELPKTYKTYSRLPHYNELKKYFTEQQELEKTFLGTNLNLGTNGYWIDSYSGDFDAWFIFDNSGNGSTRLAVGCSIGMCYSFGIRPVITLDI